MLTSDACRLARLRAVTAMAAIATALAMLLAIVALCGLLRSPLSGPPLPQTLLTSLGSDVAVNIDHQPTVNKGPSKACRKAVVAAVISSSPTTVLAALGVAAAVVVVAGWLAPRVVPAGRDPPRESAIFLTGQEILTRFCLTRR